MHPSLKSTGILDSTLSKFRQGSHQLRCNWDVCLEKLNHWLVEGEGESLSQKINQSDWERFQIQNLKISDNDKAQFIQKILAIHFDFSFSISKKQNIWLINSSVKKQKHFKMKSKALSFAIPKVNSFGVLKIPAKQILRKMAVESNDLHNDAQAFLFFASDNIAFICVSDLPDIVVCDLVKKSQKLIKKAFFVNE